MKTKIFSILFLCCLIVSFFSVFAVRSVEAETWQTWNNSDYSDRGFSEYNPIQREYFGNDFFAYAYYSSGYIYLVVGSLDNSSISALYTLYNVGTYVANSIALNYDGNNTIQVFCVGHDNWDKTYSLKIDFDLETLTPSLVYNRVIAEGATNYELKSLKWGSFIFDGDNYLITAVVKIRTGVNYASFGILAFKYDTSVFETVSSFSDTSNVIIDFCVTNYYGGKIYTIYTYSNSDNYYLTVLDGVTLSSPSALDSGLDLIGKGTRIVATGGLASGYSLLTTVSTTIDSDTIAFIYGLFDASETKADCYIVTLTYDDTSLTATSATQLYGFTSGIEVLPSFINYGLYGYQVWYSPSMSRYYWVNGISYTYEVIQYPSGTGGSSNTFFGDKLFVQKTNNKIIIWTTFGEVTPPPELPLETPIPSGIGDPDFPEWYGSNIEQFVTLLLPLIFVLIPALMFAVFFGGMGLIVGALLGSIAGTIAGVIPSWAFVILLVGIVAMLFFGRSRSGNSVGNE